MKVKHIYISDYKNLKNFSLDFRSDTFLEIFVGKNGSGKSNFFEATAEIFRHLFELDAGGSPPSFDYRVHYEIGETGVEVAWTSGKLEVNGEAHSDLRGVPLPDNIILYYSGHNSAITEIARSYQEQFKGRISSAKFREARRFVAIDTTYKDLLLSLTLVQEQDSPARQYAFERLGIASLGSELRLTLHRPLYRRRRARFSIAQDSEKNRYWRPEGETKRILDRLHRCISTAKRGQVRSEGYFEGQDQYILYLDIEAFRTEFAGDSHQEVFRALDHLKAVEMLGEISLDLNLHDGTVARVTDFSDGQFQSLYIYAIAEFFKDREYVALLDEPDSFLHPEWQFSFLNQMTEISRRAERGGHVFMTSHSAVTLIPYEKAKVRYFDTKNYHANCYELPKSVAVRKLSNNILEYSEKAQLLSIINTISIERKPVLFTEGSTDPLILTAGWRKLYDDEMPFIPFYAFSCTFIKQLLTDNRIHTEMDGLPIFALFDFDKAYDQWNGLNGTVLVDDPDLGLVKKWEEGESYAIMLPTPQNPIIRSQVIKNPATKETFKGESRYEIEHVVYGSPLAEPYFEQDVKPGGHIIAFKSDRLKTEFAKEVVPRIDAEHFETLRPLFEFLREKCRHAEAAVALV